jgi:hypothetical protein
MLTHRNVVLQRSKAMPVGKSKKQDITGPDDTAVKAKAEVVGEVKKEVPTQDADDEEETKGAKRRTVRRET